MKGESDDRNVSNHTERNDEIMADRHRTGPKAFHDDSRQHPAAVTATGALPGTGGAIAPGPLAEGMIESDELSCRREPGRRRSALPHGARVRPRHPQAARRRDRRACVDDVRNHEATHASCRPNEAGDTRPPISKPDPASLGPIHSQRFSARPHAPASSLLSAFPVKRRAPSQSNDSRVSTQGQSVPWRPRARTASAESDAIMRPPS